MNHTAIRTIGYSNTSYAILAIIKLAQHLAETETDGRVANVKNRHLQNDLLTTVATLYVGLTFIRIQL